MIETKAIESVIKQAVSRVIQNAAAAKEAGDIMEKIENQNRKLFLENLLREFRQRRAKGIIPSKSVFISYSVNSGKEYFEELDASLTRAGFKVVTGFQKVRGDEDLVLHRILRQLKRSTLYLGLLTQEISIKGIDGSEQWSPSVWTMEEKGMALALGKPFALFVQEGIHPDFWQKTLPHKVHTTFTHGTFTQKAKEVIENLEERYDEIVLDLFGSRYPLDREQPEETD